MHCAVPGSAVLAVGTAFFVGLQVRAMERSGHLSLWSYCQKFSKLGVPFLGVPIIRIVVFGLCIYWGQPISRNYQIFLAS